HRPKSPRVLPPTPELLLPAVVLPGAARPARRPHACTRISYVATEPFAASGANRRAGAVPARVVRLCAERRDRQQQADPEGAGRRVRPDARLAGPARHTRAAGGRA